MTDPSVLSSALLALQSCQSRLLGLFADLGETDGYRQYHPDLSPPGWHLGHCVYTESYWVREVMLALGTIPDASKRLYIPELSTKSARAAALPGFHELYAASAATQAENLRYLAEACDRPAPHQLLDDLFLVRFLTQHYAQHIETSCYAHNQRACHNPPLPCRFEPLAAAPLQPETVTMQAGKYPIGNGNNAASYDNERPRFLCTLDSFTISSKPVNNAQYLGFMEAGGYEDASYWDKPGWQWRCKTGRAHPEYWRRDSIGRWYGIGPQGAYSLRGNAVLAGINYFEASAFAAWAGARLPHEYEWETMQKLDLLQQAGQCWEWCINEFHPYQGFHAHPYPGYSVPYFNNRHYTLRGGSRDTLDCIKRATFRNFFPPDKRHINAGTRLVWQ